MRVLTPGPQVSIMQDKDTEGYKLAVGARPNTNTSTPTPYTSTPTHQHTNAIHQYLHYTSKLNGHITALNSTEPTLPQARLLNEHNPNDVVNRTQVRDAPD